MPKVFKMQQLGAVIQQILNAVGGKAEQSDLNAHTGNGDVHVSTGEKSRWNDTYTKTQVDNRIEQGGKVKTVSVNGGSAVQPDKHGNIEIEVPTDLKDLNDDATHRTVTDYEKSAWSGKQPAGDYATRTELVEGLNTKQGVGDYATRTELTNGLATKQPTGDYATNLALTEGLAGKQGTISDLDAIRSGAGKGATSVQGVKMEGDDEPLSPGEDGVVTIPQPEIPDSVTSVIANNELVFQTPDGQSVKGKVGVTTGADGMLHLTLTDEEGHTYSSPIAGLRVVGNALQYSNDGETWVTVQTFGNLAIKYVQASDPATGDEGDLALVGSTNAYVLKAYVGGSWVSVCDFGTLDLTSDGITMVGENKTLTQKMAEVEAFSKVSYGDAAFTENGFINANGIYTANQNFRTTELIDITGATRIDCANIINESSYFGISFYTGDDTPSFISGLKQQMGAGTGYDNPIPSSAKYARFTSRNVSNRAVTIGRYVKDAVKALEEAAGSTPTVEVDATLTQEGMAADAKAVGDKIFDKQTEVLTSADFLDEFYFANSGTVYTTEGKQITKVIDLDRVEDIVVSGINVASVRYLRLTDTLDYVKSTNPKPETASGDTFDSAVFGAAKYIRFEFTPASGDEPTVTIHRKAEWKDEVESMGLKKVVYDKETSFAAGATLINGVVTVSSNSSTKSVSAPIIVKDAELVKIHCEGGSACYALYAEDGTLVGSQVSPQREIYIKRESLPSTAYYLICSAETIYIQDVEVVFKADKHSELESEKVKKFTENCESGYYIGSGVTNTMGAKIAGNYSAIYMQWIYGIKSLLMIDGFGTGSSSTGCVFAFYDKNKTCIGMSRSLFAVVPAGARYFSASVNGSKASVAIFMSYIGADTHKSIDEAVSGVGGRVDAVESELSGAQESISNIIGNISGKKAAFLGDSITAGAQASTKYWQRFGAITGMTVTGLGVKSLSLGDRKDGTRQIFEEVDGWVKTPQDDAGCAGLSGDEDLICVMGGTNDFGHLVEIGDYYHVNPATGEKSAPIDSLGNLITDTVAGGLHKLINDIRDKCYKAKIVFMTPLSRTEGGGGDFNSHRKNGGGIISRLIDISSASSITVTGASVAIKQGRFAAFYDENGDFISSTNVSINPTRTFVWENPDQSNNETLIPSGAKSVRFLFDEETAVSGAVLLDSNDIVDDNFFEYFRYIDSQGVVTKYGGYYLQDYADCIKDICAFYCIPVLDLLSMSNIDLTSIYSYVNYEGDNLGYHQDGLHPLAPAHKEIGFLLARFVTNNVAFENDFGQGS